LLFADAVTEIMRFSVLKIAKNYKPLRVFYALIILGVMLKWMK